jgi:polar amino acid transport system permease protein
MHYTVHFGQIWQYLPDLAGGALLSFWIALLAFAGGLMLGLCGALLRVYAARPFSSLARAYVVAFTNTPQLVQIYFLYFTLPDFGVLFSPFLAVVIGMTLNGGAYLTEILRGGLLSVRQTELEAAQVMGFRAPLTMRVVVLPHLARTIYPALSNQYITMTLGTSMAAVFGVEELTGRAFSIEAQTFRSIEIFSVTAAMYVAVTLVASALLVALGRAWAPRHGRVA